MAMPGMWTPLLPLERNPSIGVQQNASEYTLGYVAHTRKQVLRRHPIRFSGPRNHRLPPNSRRRSGSAQSGTRRLLLLRWRRDHRPVSTLRHSRPISPAFLQGPRLRDQLSDHPAAHLNLGARVRLFPAFLTRISRLEFIFGVFGPKIACQAPNPPNLITFSNIPLAC